MANARLLERLLPAMAAEAGISVAELRELMIPVDMDTTADVSSAEDDVSDVEIDADDGAASPPAPIASPLRVSGGSHTERVRAVIESRTSHGLVLRTLRHVSYDVLRYMVPSDVVAYLHHLPRGCAQIAEAEAQRAQIHRGGAATAHQATESTTKPPNSRPPPPPPPRPRSHRR